MSQAIDQARALFMKQNGPVDSFVLVEFDGTNIRQWRRVTVDFMNTDILCDDEYCFWGSDDYSKAPSFYVH